MRTNPPTLDLEQALAAAELPALPQCAIRMLQICQDREAGPTELAAAIQSDLGLAGQVLRFANSSYFAFVRRVASVRHAVTLVGMRTIKNFVLWSAVFSQVPDPKCGRFRLRHLWEDSLRRALLARDLVALFGSPGADDAFAGALLQDMAIPLLSTGSPALYARLLEVRDCGQTRLSTLEREAFGWTHAEAGRRIALHWNLPENLAAMVGGHLEIDRWAAQRASHPAELAVALSALLPSGVDPRWLECETLAVHYQRVVPDGSPPLASILSQIDDEFRKLAPVVTAGNPRLSLAREYREAIGPGR